jgi:lysophospholipase L1-like esterase
VSPGATQHAPPVNPDRGFAVPAPARLATTTLERPAEPKHRPPARHPFLTNPHRSIRGTNRFGLAAGQVLVVILVCFLVWTLLSAHSLHKASEAAPDGARRTVSLAVLGPIDGLTHLLFIDRLAGVFQGMVGHNPDKVSPGGLADQPTGPPPTQPSPLPTMHPTPHNTGVPHGGGNGNGNGNGNGKHHPTPHPHPTKHPGGGATLPPLRVPTAAKPLKVLVVGDSFSQDVELGLAPATDSKYFRIIEKGIQSTGLSRLDYYNWPNALAVFMQQYHPDIVIVMVGGNDPQTIHTGSGDLIPFGVGDPRWPKTYSARVDQMMNTASQNHTHVLWVGMPIMGSSQAYSDNIHFLDAIYEREAAKHPDVLYVDTWPLFAKNGKYSDYLPDKHGNLQLVRAPDKIHLSAAGNKILTGALIRAMKYHAGWHLAPKVLG